MVSRNQIKFIHSLEHKKFRKEHGLFVAEGKKIVTELLNSSLKIVSLFATGNFNKSLVQGNYNFYDITEQELERISFLSSPNDVLCIAEIPKHENAFHQIYRQLSLYLDNIKDPGNLGTLIRIADWFGIEYIFCSPGCVDVYNPKVVQATMGSIARVKVIYTEAEDLILKLKKISTMNDQTAKIPGYSLYATMMNGKNIYKESLSQNGLIILGNESEGISDRLAGLADQKISIPSFGNAESLNVAASAAVICSEFRRRMAPARNSSGPEKF